MKADTESLPEAIQSEVYMVLRARKEGAGSEEIRQHQNYLLCRRSMHMRPVLDTGRGIKSAGKVFMKEMLDMEISTINIISVEAPVPTQQLP